MSTKKKKILPKDLNGIFVYHEEKRTVYAPPFSRRGYIISDSNIDQYVSYVQAYLIAIIIFVVAYIIYRKLTIPILLASMFIAVNLFLFYRSFLSKANIIANYKRPKRDSFAQRQAAALDEKQIITIIIASPLLAAAIMFNSYLNGFKDEMFYMMLFISLIAIAYGILHIYVLILKRKSD